MQRRSQLVSFASVVVHIHSRTTDMDTILHTDLRDSSLAPTYAALSSAT